MYQRGSDALDKLNGVATKGLVFVGVGVLAALMFLTVTDVVLRYVFTLPLAWSYELTRVLLLIIIFSSLSYVTLRNSHIRITLITSHLPQRFLTILNLTTSMVGLFMLCLLTWQGVVEGVTLFESKQIFSNLQVPVFIVMPFLVIGFIAFCLALLREVLSSFYELLQETGYKAWLWLGFAAVIGGASCLVPFWYPLGGFALGTAQWAILGVVIFIILLLSGAPIFYGLALVGYMGVGCLTNLDGGLHLLATVPMATSMRYTYSVIPLFVLMGQFAFHSGIIKDLYETMSKWLGRMPGGLAIASIGGCAGFASVAGSSVASGAAMSAICYPELQRYKYDPALSTGSIAAGGTLGIMIPPSLDFVVFGVLTSTSIGTLFIAGIGPGLLMAALFMVTAYLLCWRNPKLGPPGPPASLKEKMISIRGIAPVLGIFLLVIGGIYLGVFTPTEAAGVGAFGSFVITLGRKRLTRSSFYEALRDSIETTGMIIIILISAMIFGYFLALTRVPHAIATFFVSLPVTPFVIMVLIMLMYVVNGCFLPSFATAIITIPIIFPAVMALGFDPVWYGVLMVTTVELGMLTPPLGIMAFIISGVTKVPASTVFRGLFPFLIADFIAVALIMNFPAIPLFLTQFMRY